MTGRANRAPRDNSKDVHEMNRSVSIRDYGLNYD